MRDWLTTAWYRGHWLLLLLAPLSWLFGLVAAVRRLAFRHGWIQAQRFPVPVIVIGNISVGGTGKTPLTLHVVELLKRHGWRPGIVSRGYGGRAQGYPLLVGPQSAAAETGDEPMLLHRAAGVPVAVDPLRCRAVDYLLQRGLCDIVIADDGLQHYALHRDLELAVVDGERGLGNRRLLPAGPLREPVGRLASVDAIIINGGSGAPDFAGKTPVFRFSLKPGLLLPVGISVAPAQAPQPPCRVHAVAGIGNPERFFRSLELSGYDVIRHAFADHHQFQPQDLAFTESLPVIMTTKDAVKCGEFAGPDVWQLPVTVDADPGLDQLLLAFLGRFHENPTHAR
ncbi:lipid-A-disaccharide kinase [Fluviicoccus keumensis]|uniref:Tetraacyldisaccharide 4'-kinase n=1 Tax=Fluviicoccus keumensis TaxID=1435465 RepID=A0A4Q7Z463_9GAMM|nr:tetraacyldisaccharide 4'-kinase [Fluviicoccus keumensis]RZU45028.1 lipid-A-disaccharide kinase [Fluviicoccus keumensis]